MSSETWTGIGGSRPKRRPHDPWSEALVDESRGGPRPSRVQLLLAAGNDAVQIVPALAAMSLKNVVGQARIVIKRSRIGQLLEGEEHVLVHAAQIAGAALHAALHAGPCGTTTLRGQLVADANVSGRDLRAELCHIDHDTFDAIEELLGHHGPERGWMRSIDDWVDAAGRWFVAGGLIDPLVTPSRKLSERSSHRTSAADVHEWVAFPFRTRPRTTSRPEVSLSPTAVITARTMQASMRSQREYGPVDADTAFCFYTSCVEIGRALLDHPAALPDELHDQVRDTTPSGLRDTMASLGNTYLVRDDLDRHDGGELGDLLAVQRRSVQDLHDATTAAAFICSRLDMSGPIELGTPPSLN